MLSNIECTGVLRMLNTQIILLYFDNGRIADNATMSLEFNELGTVVGLVCQ